MTTAVDETIGGKIRAARVASGLSQQEVATRMGVMGHPMHQTTVAKMEAGSRPVLASELVALAMVLARKHGDLLP